MNTNLLQKIYTIKWCTTICSIILILSPHALYSQYIEYVENLGQWNNNVLYKADLPAGAMFLKHNSITFNFRHPDDFPRHNHNDCNTQHNNINHQNNETFDFDYDEPCFDLNKPVRFHAYRMQFKNANSGVAITSQNKLPGYNNYFIGNDKRYWASGVRKFAKVKYENLYNDIHFIVGNRNNTVIYDFIVKAGASHTDIIMQYIGIERIFLKNNNLHIKTSVNEIIDLAPRAYQIINNDSIAVECNFKINNNEVSFVFPNGYNKNYDLIIDPELIFSRYSGSSADNFGYTATYDYEGHLYSGSTVFGIGYPVTLGAYDSTFGAGEYYNNTDMGITKWEKDGSAPVYSTYIGGNFDDELPHSLVVNQKGELYILGTTASNDYPTTDNAFDRTFNNQTNTYKPIYPIGLGVFMMYGTDIVVTKLNSDGTELIGSTYVGGSHDDGFNANGTNMILYNGQWYYGGDTTNYLKYNYGDEVRGEIIVDEFDNCYIASTTRSDDFPVTSNVYQPSKAGGKKDGCIFKMNNDLSAMEWGSYLGGSSDDAAFSLTLDTENHVYVTGGTTSTDFPVTSGAYSVTYSGGPVDAYIAHIKNDGSQLLHATYFGSEKYDMAFFVNLDRYNNAYIFGQTRAPDSTLIHNVNFSIPNTGQFISKLSPELNKLEYSTVFGKTTSQTGTPVQVDISPTAFLVDVCRRVYISGWGGETNNSGYGAHGGDTFDLPVKNTEWSNFYQPKTDGSDFYIMVLDQNIDSIHYATYIGGDVSHEHVDGGTSRFDKRGNIYQAVCAGCGGNSDFPIAVPAGVDGTNKSYNCNIAVFKMKLNLPKTIAEFELPQSGCAPLSVQFNNLSDGIAYHWDFGDGNTSTQENPQHTFEEDGTYMVQLIASDPDGCNLADTIIKRFEVYKNQRTQLPGIEVCEGETIQIGIDESPNQGFDYKWVPTDNLSETDVANPYAKIEDDIEYKLLKTQNNCIDTMVRQITVKPPVNEKYRAAHWEFGQNIILDFSRHNSITTSFTPLSSFEGSSSISDIYGNHLLSTNGRAVTDSNNNAVPGGTSLNGDINATQTAIFVPYPDESAKYLVFTTDRENNSGGLQYAVVDANLNNGNGAVSQLSTVIERNASERIAAYKHANNTDYWILTKINDTDEFHAYLFTANGLDANVVKSFSGEANNSNTGQLKISPNGRYAACANFDSGTIEVFYFDNSNGKLKLFFTLSGYPSAYGVEFAPESSFLYFSTAPIQQPAKVFQVKLNLPTINKIKQSVVQLAEIQSDEYFSGGALQLAPNDKIYMAKYNLNSLATIEYPDSAAHKATFNENAISLNDNSYLGLPSFPASYFRKTDFFVENNCFGEAVNFKINTNQNVYSFNWNFGDKHSANNSSKSENPTHVYPLSGEYNIELHVHYECFTDTIRKKIEIRNTQVDLRDDITECGTEQVVLDAGNDFENYTWQPNGQRSSIIKVNISDNYSVEATDLYGCTSNDDIQVNLYPDVDVTATAVDESCYGLNDNKLIFNGTRGKQPYSFSGDKSNYITDNVWVGVDFGMQRYWIKDANGCLDSIDLETSAAEQIILNTKPTHLDCFGDINGRVELSASGGEGVYSFAINHGDFMPTSVFESLSAGIYSFQAVDNHHCYSEVVQTKIISPPQLTVHSSTTDVTCYSYSDGEIQLIASGGSGGYQFTLKTESTNTTGYFTNLVSDIYSFSVNDINNCAANRNVLLTQPAPLSISAQKQDVSCYNYSDGIVVLNREGGTGNAYYSINRKNYIETNIFSDLPPLVYTFHAIDDNLCESNFVEIEINNKPELILSFNKTDVYCYGYNTGLVNLIATGGNEPYSFNMNMIEWERSTLFNNLNAGIYTFSVRDKNMCVENKLIEIEEPQPIVAKKVNQIPLHCWYSQNAELEISVTSGGKKPYEILWHSTPEQTGATAKNLSAGIIEVTIEDSENCERLFSFEIVPPPPIETKIESEDIICFSDSAHVKAISTGGTPPLTYQWYESNLPIHNSATILLPGGNYLLQTTDANNCITTQNVNIPQPPEINVIGNVTHTLCAGICDGSIQLDVYGGVTPYFFDWYESPSAGSFQNRNATDLCKGKYMLKLTDSLGCQKKYEFDVLEGTYLPPLEIDADSFKIYRGQSITLQATTGYKTYEWHPTIGLNNANSYQVVASPVQTTTYRVNIEDVNGCKNQQQILLDVLDVVCDEPYIFVPNAFTPKNNEFGTNILFVRSQMITDFQFAIFNRWGEKVFETNDLAKGWDGTFKGKPAQSAVYMYYLRATCHNGEVYQKKGNITLLR